MLLGASLMLCVSSGAGVALAGNPTNPASGQYTEVVPPSLHHGGTKRRTSTNTTSTTPTAQTPSTQVVPTTTGASNTITKPHHRATKPRHKKSGKPRQALSRGARILPRPNHGAARLTVAAATGSGGGMGVWLLVILILVLVTGSAFGILRYRRSH